MRDYAKIAPQFWIGTTGKTIRKLGQEAQIVALYLLSSPHANMIGLYHLPIAYLAADTGIPIEGASKTLQSLIEAGFCGYDDDAEVVFVFEMARFQIGEQLKPMDKQCAGAQNAYDSVPSNRFLPDFFEKYSLSFHLKVKRGLASPSEAPPKQRTGTGTGTGTGTEEPPPTPRKRGERAGTSNPDPEGFEKFWACYPKKVGKGAAEKAWAKLGRNAALAEQIAHAVKQARISVEWQRDGGRFIPNPATWLNERRWEDTLQVAAYSEREQAVFAAYREILADGKGWPEAVMEPFSAERAVAIRDFLGFSEKPNWVREYLRWIADSLDAKAGYGFDWVISREAYLRAREGNFAKLREAA